MDVNLQRIKELDKDPCPVCGGDLRLGPHTHSGVWYRHVAPPRPRVKVKKLRNMFKPRWWQLRFRYRLWKSRHEHNKARARLSPDLRRRLDEADERFEHRILYGDPDA
jgi:hypothetical protein